CAFGELNAWDRGEMAERQSPLVFPNQTGDLPRDSAHVNSQHAPSKNRGDQFLVSEGRSATLLQFFARAAVCRQIFDRFHGIALAIFLSNWWFTIWQYSRNWPA